MKRLLAKLRNLILGIADTLEKVDRKLPKRLKALLLVVIFVAFGLILANYLHTHSLAILNPQGKIARDQRNLLIFAAVLSLVVVIPVFAMTAAFAWRYRESNTKASYRPEWDHSRTAETIWWGIPLLLIVILSVVTWNSSHALDPFKPISSPNKPVTIQVVALQWKWLFIYPDQHIATVNYVRFPQNTPVNFEITADAPMNSFWIPQLGGQVYAMSGMATKLSLMADHIGSYRGSSANISGEGFSDMHFTAESMTDQNFTKWVDQAGNTNDVLDQSVYDQLAQPSLHNPPVHYRLGDDGLYNGIIMKFMDPSQHDSLTEHNRAHTDYGVGE